MRALTAGDRVAYVRVSRFVNGLLSRWRLFDLQHQWDHICQKVLLQLIKSIRAGAIRDADRFLGYCTTLTRRVGLRSLRSFSEQRKRASQA